MPLILPNPMNLPLQPMSTAAPAEPPPAMPMVPDQPESMGIAGGAPGGQTNPTGGVHSVGGSSTGPRNRSAGRGAQQALKAQNSVNDAIKSSGLVLPLTKQAFARKAIRSAGEFLDGAGHALLDEVDKQKKTTQSNDHRTTPPKQNRLA